MLALQEAAKNVIRKARWNVGYFKRQYERKLLQGYLGFARYCNEKTFVV